MFHLVVYEHGKPSYIIASDRSRLVLERIQRKQCQELVSRVERCRCERDKAEKGYRQGVLFVGEGTR